MRNGGHVRDVVPSLITALALVALAACNEVTPKPKSILVTCVEEFPDNQELAAECSLRGIRAENNAKVLKAQRDAR
jgi:hypothetical protein